MSENEKMQLTKAELLLYLDVLAYFPEFSHRRYATVGEFIKEYFRLSGKKRPVTMFSGFCSDESSGVTALLKKAQRIKRLMELPIIYSSAGSDKYTSVCLAEDTFSQDGKLTSREIYVIIGCNYRFGEYVSDLGKTSTWKDNFLGAVQTDTFEQKSILRFYDEAVKKALSDERLSPRSRVTINLSGHSKAGNLAQYIAVMRDNADYCYSFDGQGFSRRFLAKYSAEIDKRGRKIINICPDISIAGSLLDPIPNARTVFIETGFMREKGAHTMPLYYHIPVSVLDKDGKMRPVIKKREAFSDMLHRVSVLSVSLAERASFIDEKRGLGNIGSAIMHFFKGHYLKAIKSLLNKDSLLMLAVAAAVFGVYFPAAAAETIKRRNKRR